MRGEHCMLGQLLNSSAASSRRRRSASEISRVCTMSTASRAFNGKRDGRPTRSASEVGGQQSMSDAIKGITQRERWKDDPRRRGRAPARCGPRGSCVAQSPWDPKPGCNALGRPDTRASSLRAKRAHSASARLCRRARGAKIRSSMLGQERRAFARAIAGRTTSGFQAC